MSRNRLIVLKFGGSVLRDESTLRLAVHEIYRWRRRGWRVLAVVSALSGRTDELLRLALTTAQAGVGSDGYAAAALVATGELHSAALLGLQLDRAGVRACVLWPASFDLVAEGSALDADPKSMCVPELRAAVARHGVVVIPGYIAHDRQGRPVVMGRGGSDLSALFIANAMGADRCRLIKDVDGLYDSDPARTVAVPEDRTARTSPTGQRTARRAHVRDSPPRRYARATFHDALATDGSIVQHKAVRFAQCHELGFELGGLNGVLPTKVGAEKTRFAPCEPRRRLKVALLGLGTVGGGVCELLRQMPEQFEITAVAVRDTSRARPEINRIKIQETVDGPKVTSDAVEAARSGPDIVVEAIGGCDIARRAIVAALETGAHVVTANKSLLAAHGEKLALETRTVAKFANHTGRRPWLLCSAAVGGSMPLLERIAEACRAGGTRSGGIRSIYGVINGTTNFVLDRVSMGMSLTEATCLAQSHGYAEQDPSHDLEGVDAAEKLCMIAQRIGLKLHARDIDRTALTEEVIATALARLAPGGGPLRHVAILSLNRGQPEASVRLLQVGKSDPLARATGAGNAAVIEFANGQREVIEGTGAGRWPTAEAVVADLLEIARRCAHSRRAAGADQSLAAAGAPTLHATENPPSAAGDNCFCFRDRRSWGSRIRT